jgi:hypothetical protein
LCAAARCSACQWGSEIARSWSGATSAENASKDSSGISSGRSSNPADRESLGRLRRIAWAHPGRRRREAVEVIDLPKKRVEADEGIEHQRRKPWPFILRDLLRGLERARCPKRSQSPELSVTADDERVDPTGRWQGIEGLVERIGRDQEVAEATFTTRPLPARGPTYEEVAQLEAAFSRYRAIGHAPSLVFEITVSVARARGSCTDRNETPAS